MAKAQIIPRETILATQRCRSRGCDHSIQIKANKNFLAYWWCRKCWAKMTLSRDETAELVDKFQAANDNRKPDLTAKPPANVNRDPKTVKPDTEGGFLV